MTPPRATEIDLGGGRSRCGCGRDLRHNSITQSPRHPPLGGREGAMGGSPFAPRSPQVSVPATQAIVKVVGTTSQDHLVLRRHGQRHHRRVRPHLPLRMGGRRGDEKWRDRVSVECSGIEKCIRRIEPMARTHCPAGGAWMLQLPRGEKPVHQYRGGRNFRRCVCG